MKRRIIIGAIGGRVEPEARADVRAFGLAVARAGCILLTGGDPPLPGVDASKVPPEVKNLTMLGTVDALASGNDAPVARLIGILPSAMVKWSTCPGRLALSTGLHHIQRNAINGLTPDVLVVFGGSTGTLSELGFAAAAKKPVVCFPRAVTMLRQKYAQHTADGEVERFFRSALGKYPEPGGARLSATDMIDVLDEVLATASDYDSDTTSLVAYAVSLAMKSSPGDQTGFPGLPGDVQSKGRFESEVRRLSE